MSKYGNTRETLILRVKDQYDEKAWQEFVEIYRRYTYVVIRRLGVDVDPAEELTQNILLKLWEKLPDYKYDPQIARFRTWLSRVIHNTVLNFRRQERRQPVLVELGDIHPINSDTEKMMEKEWETYLSNLAMERIENNFSGKAISVFNLSIEGKSASEIAQELEIEENSVYRLKNRVKNQLIQEIKVLKADLD
ncbi:MAG: RNA polymerase sigma factor [Lentisphaeraceae bacterium]|nr:RNA polymerase sigma factor [Lentisphaeraceae bacterium]